MSFLQDKPGRESIGFRGTSFGFPMAVHMIAVHTVAVGMIAVHMVAADTVVAPPKLVEEMQVNVPQRVSVVVWVNDNPHNLDEKGREPSWAIEWLMMLYELMGPAWS